MASTTLILLVFVSLISQSFQDLNDNEIEIDEPSLIKEAASDIKKEQNKHTLGSLFNNIMENGGDDLLNSFMSQFGKDGGGQLLQGLGSMFTSQKEGKKAGSEGSNVLENLGNLANLMGSLQGLKNNAQDGGSKEDGAATLIKSLGSLGSLFGQGGKSKEDGASSILEGIGSLLGQLGQTNEDGKGKGGANLLKGLSSLLNQGGGDGKQNEDLSEMFGSVLNYFNQPGEKEDKPRKKPKKVEGSKKSEKPDPKAEPDFNMDDLLTLAGTLFSKGDQKDGKQEPNFLTLLPSILQTFNAFVGPEATERAKSHEGHSSLMPPALEKFHIMFDHFIHSEMGQNVITALGAEKSFKVFLDDKGRFSYKKFGEMMENHSYRRQWIKIVTDRIAEYLQFASDPRVYNSYIAGAQIFFNSYLKAQGFPRSTHFDPKRSVETISALVNYGAKKYFDIKIDSKEYVKPAVIYVKELLVLAENSGTLQSLSDSNELSRKLADTINLEIIEPLARVNRAYRYATITPKCERYVLCLVNKDDQNELESLPGLKKLLYRGSSLVAGWFLSGQTGTPFWTLYTDIMESANCKKLYSSECDGFHAEEIKVTTEYIHNEL